MSGCIPVFCQDGVYQPGHDVLPYDEFSVRHGATAVPWRSHGATAPPRTHACGEPPRPFDQPRASFSTVRLRFAMRTSRML